MAYNNIIARTGAQALMPEEVANTIIQNTVEQSAAMTLFRRVTVARNQVRLPVLSVLPVAYFINGDTGLKQTTEQDWTNKYLNVEEIACIVPIPENVLDDSAFDIWGEVQPRIVEAIGRTLDAAVFFGVNAPLSWPTNINASALSAGNQAFVGSAQAVGGFHNDVDLIMATVEADGFDCSGFVADRRVKSLLRQARATTGARLLTGEDASDAIAPDLSTYLGLPIRYTMTGLWPQFVARLLRALATSGVRLFTGDWSQFVLGIRRDISWKLLDQAVLTDNRNAIQYNLAQQDMVAMRVTFRVAWQVANPYTYAQPTAARRYPAGVLQTNA